jgi:hypothetical protein
MTNILVVSSVIITRIVTTVSSSTTPYKANKPSVTDKIAHMVRNSLCVRDARQVLVISITTVIAY